MFISRRLVFPTIVAFRRDLWPAFASTAGWESLCSAISVKPWGPHYDGNQVLNWTCRKYTGRFVLPLAAPITAALACLRQNSEDTSPLSNQCSRPTHLKGLRENNENTEHFFVKENRAGNRDWPVGKYCIYQRGKCPFAKNTRAVIAVITGEPAGKTSFV